jgi:tetratricopeptide (TPR) repeat protein
VLVHSALYAAVRELPARQLAGFRRLVARLASGDWSGGARVKKLRGCARPVFEARHDAGDRLLFTLASSAPSDGASATRTHLNVWDLVPHDDVDGRARRLNTSADSEFLSYDVLDVEEITEPPPQPTAAFDEIPSEHGGAAGVIDYMLPPEGFAAPEREDVVGGVRWYVLPERLLASDDEWQRLFDAEVDELELKLTAEQYAVVRAPGPVLLSGSAGSGKTTISVHRLAAAAASPARTLYLTYSRWLLDHARRLFRDLCAARGAEPPIPPDFFTFDDLYRHLAAARGATTPASVADYPDFRRWLATAARGAEPALAWEEIRSILKGACLDPSRPMLSWPDYEAKGRKRAPVFAGERRRVHEIAAKWQEHLKANGWLDEIDLCREALRGLRPPGPYDHVVCDEAQDLAEVQVELLLRLLRSAKLDGLLLAGDPQQVVNPSGFRWAEVRSAIRERFKHVGRPTPPLSTLSRNFRSSRNIVALANAVLQLKRDRTGRSEGDEDEESLVAGAAPLLVQGEEAALEQAVAGFGPRCAIVAGTPELRDRLARRLQTTRVFTVQDAKGLEFDAVVAWGLVAAEAASWRRLLDPEQALREDPACRRTLHHLYVAVTRARRHLALHEPKDAPPAWTTARFAPLLDVAPPDALARLFVRSAEPEEWAKEGEYFLARGRARQAAECFRRAGLERREQECLAIHHEAQGDPGEAARLWTALGEAARAAACFERAGQFAKAAELFEGCGDHDASRRCRIRVAEAARDWKKAAAAWEEIRAWADAARCWSSAGQRAQQLRCLAHAGEAEGRHDEAARRWEEAERWREAAGAWRRAGQAADAHRCAALGAEHEKHWLAAATAWRLAGDADRGKRCAARAAQGEKRWADAGGLFEELGDHEEAMKAYRAAGRPADAERCEVVLDIAAGRLAKAAETLEQRKQWARAAEAWRQAHAAKQAPRRAIPLPFPAAALRPWAPKLGPAVLSLLPAQRLPATGRHAHLRELACMLRDLEDSGRFEAAAEAWAVLADDGQALRCEVSALERAGRAIDGARRLEQFRHFEAAAERYARAGDMTSARRCEALRLERSRSWARAADAWAALGDAERAAACRAKVKPKRAHATRGQLGLFAPAPAAARRATPPQVRAAHGLPRTAVLAAVDAHPGLTCEQLQVVTQLPPEIVKADLKWLWERGLVEKSGRARGTRYRRTPAETAR